MDKKRVKALEKQFNVMLNSKFREFGSLDDLSDKIGVYSIWKDGEIIYIGKTTNQRLKRRVSEILDDFRTHTLNKKLLIELISSKYNEKLKSKGIILKRRFRTEEKRDFIAKGIFTEQEFQLLNNNLRKDMRSNFKIKCLPFQKGKERDVTLLEHFAIAIKNPKYND